MRHILSKFVADDELLTNVQEGDSQPNAVDLRVGKIFRLEDKQFEISENTKKHRGTYEILMENIVKIPEGYAGWVITRSTLNRNGLFITSGLYDSGYHGVMAGALHVEGGPAKIEKGTRVAQFLMFEAETLSMYDGDYGIGKEHDKKYGN